MTLVELSITIIIKKLLFKQLPKIIKNLVFILAISILVIKTSRKNIVLN